MNNDDYLWDRSGEPDPDVERLERVLGKYRYQAKPLSPALHSRLSERRGGWIRLAAIAAAILVVLAGVWIFKIQNKSVAAPDQLSSKTTEKQDEKPTAPPKAKEPAIATTKAPPSRPPRKIHRNVPTERPPAAESLRYDGSAFVAERQPMINERQPMINPFIDVETARHIERAQLLLRAFRNTRDTSSQPDPELSYERQRSRGLLYTNVLLRRDAEAKGNLPVEDLLGSLEPFLLDIANLPDRPSNNEVRLIKERMQKKEIVSALQVYSAPMLSQVF